MGMTLGDRIRFWICDTFGHKREKDKRLYWEHDGKRFHACQRCLRIARVPRAR